MPACEELDLQAAEGSMSQVTQELVLPPSTMWEIAAREVNTAGMMGTATSLRLQVPSAAPCALASTGTSSSCAAPIEPSTRSHVVAQGPSELKKVEVPALNLRGINERSEELGFDDRSSEISAHDADSGSSTDADVPEAEHHRRLERRKTWASSSERHTGALKSNYAEIERDSLRSASLAIKALNAAAREKALVPLTARGRLQLCKAGELEGRDNKDPNALLSSREGLRSSGQDTAWSKSEQGWAARRRVTIGAVAEDKDLKPPPHWAVHYR